LLPRGEETTFEIVRDDEHSAVTITPREKGEVEGEELALERFDFTVKAINQFDNAELFFYRPEGVFVFGVRHPGNAANAGIRDGDILLKIDDEEIVTIEDAKRVHARLIEDVKKKHRVVVVVLRGGLMRQLVLDFDRDYSK
jgi:S1-C subfamily serine protease